MGSFKKKEPAKIEPKLSAEHLQLINITISVILVGLLGQKLLPTNGILTRHTLHYIRHEEAQKNSLHKIRAKCTLLAFCLSCGLQYEQASLTAAYGFEPPA